MLSKDIRAQQLFIRAMTQAQLGNHDSAVDLYGESLKLAPNTPAVLSALAESYEALGDRTSAVFNASRASELDPENIHYYFQLASLHLASGDAEKATQTYHTLLEHDPGRPEALFELARIYTIHGNFDDAIRTYEQLLAEIGEDRDVRNEILQLHVRTGNQEGVEATLKQMMEAHPHDAALPRMLGEFYLRQDRDAEAVELLEKAYEIDQTNVETVLSLTELYRARGENERAEDLLRRSSHVEGSTPGELLSQATPFYARSAEDEDARATASRLLERVLELDPENADALLMLGDIRQTQERLSDAADLFYRVLETNPRDPNLWVQTAGTYLQAELRGRAMEVADEGLLLFPGHVPLLRISGYALMEAYENRAAVDRFEEAVTIVEEDESESHTRLSEMYAALGLLYTRLNDVDAADRVYEKALAADPENASALNNYAYSLAERNIRLEEALEMAGRAVELNPDVAAFLDTLGWIYFKIDDAEHARQWISRAVETGDATASVFEHLGDVYERLGDEQQARALWRRALEMNPASSSAQRKLGR